MRKRKRALWLAVVVLFAPTAFFLLAVESLNLFQSVPLPSAEADGLMAISEKTEAASSMSLLALPQR